MARDMLQLSRTSPGRPEKCFKRLRFHIQHVRFKFVPTGPRPPSSSRLSFTRFIPANMPGRLQNKARTNFLNVKRRETNQVDRAVRSHHWRWIVSDPSLHRTSVPNLNDLILFLLLSTAVLDWNHPCCSLLRERTSSWSISISKVLKP